MKTSDTTPTLATRRWIKVVAGAIALVCLGLQLGRRLDLAIIALVLWLATLAFVDRPALNRLKMPKFWLITIVLALGSGMFLGARDMELAGLLSVSSRGLEAGALMVARGAFIFALASWAMRALRTSSIQELAKRLGLGNLGLAVATAFGVLPAIRDSLVQQRAEAIPEGGRFRLGRARELAARAVSDAVALADNLSEELRCGDRRAKLVALVGAKGSGKTTTAQALIGELGKLGLTVGGVIQPAIEGETGRLGYDLQDPRDGATVELARRSTTGRFDFAEDAWPWAAERLALAKKNCDVVVVDEMGLLEAKGEGHVRAVLSLNASPGRAAVLLAAVREGCLPPLSEHLGEPTLELRAPLNAQQAAAKAELIAAIVAQTQTTGAGG